MGIKTTDNLLGRIQKGKAGKTFMPKNSHVGLSDINYKWYRETTE